MSSLYLACVQVDELSQAAQSAEVQVDVFALSQAPQQLDFSQDFSELLLHEQDADASIAAATVIAIKTFFILSDFFMFGFIPFQYLYSTQSTGLQI